MAPLPGLGGEGLDPGRAGAWGGSGWTALPQIPGVGEWVCAFESLSCCHGRRRGGPCPESPEDRAPLSEKVRRGARSGSPGHGRSAALRPPRHLPQPWAPTGSLGEVSPGPYSPANGVSRASIWLLVPPSERDSLSSHWLLAAESKALSPALGLTEPWAGCRGPGTRLGGQLHPHRLTLGVSGSFAHHDRHNRPRRPRPSPRCGCPTRHFSSGRWTGLWWDVHEACEGSHDFHWRYCRSCFLISSP